MSRFGGLKPAFGDYRTNLGDEVSLSYLTGLPDPSQISSPALTVVFKNLLKRDSTTKEKALNELLVIVESGDSNNDIINDSQLQRCWVLIYSKLSIDISISVRSYSHKIQGAFCKLLGKQSTKHLKDTIGPWIAGTFDTDRSVALSAQQALDQVFPTPEKQDAIFNIFEEALINFVSNTLKNETAISLSDERYISADESEAKYFRVIRSCISILSKLIERRYVSQSTAQASKKTPNLSENYLEIIAYSKLWKFAYTTDVSVSKATLELIGVLMKDKCASHELVEGSLEEIASNVVYKSLKSCQPLVSTYLLQALIALTRKYPNVWQLASSKKTTSFSVLCKFISQGSRRSSIYYWPSLLALLTSLPGDISPYGSNSEHRDQLLAAIADGVSKEPIMSKHAAWGAYLTVIEKAVQGDVDGSHIIMDKVLTDLRNELIIVDKPTRLSPDLIQVISKKLSNFISLNWNMVSESLNTGVEEILKRKSYDSLENIVALINKTAIDPSHKAKFSIFLSDCIYTLLEKLKSGLDAFEIHVIKAFLSSFENVLFPNPSLLTQLHSFITDSLSAFIVSDANEDLVVILQLYAKHADKDDSSAIQESIDKSFTSIIKSSYEDKKLSYLSSLLKAASSLKDLIEPIDSVSQYLRYLLYISGTPGNDTTPLWESILYGISSHGIFISEDAASDAMNFFATTASPPTERVLWIFEKLLAVDNEYFTNFISAPKGKEFVSYLWTIESNPAVEKLLHAIETPATGNFDVLCEGLLEEVQTNSAIDTAQLLVERGQRLLGVESTGQVVSLEKLLFIDADTYNQYLEKVFKRGVSSNLAVADSLDGAVLLVKDETIDSDESNPELLGELASIAIYCKSLALQNKDVFSSFPQSSVEKFVLFLGYASGIISSSTFNGEIVSDAEVTSTVFGFTNDVSEYISTVFEGYSAPQVVSAIEGSDDSLQSKLISVLWKLSMAYDTKAYFSARLLATIFDKILSNTSDSEVEPVVTKLRPQFRKSSLGTTALLHAFQKYLLQFPVLSNLRNQFASDLIGLTPEKLNEVGLKSLIYLNMLLDVPPSEVTNELIPLNRLLMFLRPLFSWHNVDGFDPSFLKPRIEITKLLTKIVSLYPRTLPTSIWESCIEILEQNFISMSESLPLRYYNLRYLVTLQKLVPTISDLEDVWGDKSDGIHEELFDVLYTAEPSANQPESLTNLQLQKAVLSVSTSLLDYEKLYGLLSISSSDIQRTAFILLNKHIPLLQEERSIEYALRKSKISSNEDDESSDIANVSQQLLSVVSQPQQPDESYHSMTGYLWAWQLIYDHFQNASYDLRRAYINQLRKDSIVDSLLDFISNYILDGSLNKIAEKSKELDNIDSYDGTFFVEEVDEEVDLLLFRSFFLVLKYTGSLAKSWFLNVNKRNIIIAVEKFSEKYVSPMIIKGELNNVEASLESANSSINDESMNAKIVRSTNEVRAYYTTDDQTMEISIKIPVLYPLRDLQVEGVRRIGVREKQWRAWLLASQAIGTAQNGSIIDSLELFKRNVSMHFEGIDECAICYSILHEDHSLPNKTCTTCKKKFHADCLYKWFKSAGSSSCPLCRTTFSFRHGLN